MTRTKGTEVNIKTVLQVLFSLNVICFDFRRPNSALFIHVCEQLSYFEIYMDNIRELLDG